MAAVPMDPMLQSHGLQSLSSSSLADEVSLSLPGHDNGALFGSDEIVFLNEVSSTNQDSPHDKNLQDEVSLVNQEAPSNKILSDEFTATDE